jgi:hypothetical protein
VEKTTVLHEPVWLRTDEKVEAIRALQEVHDQLIKIDEQGILYSWKWIVIALHNALQGFMVWALRHGHDRDIIREKIDKKTGKTYRQLYSDYVEKKEAIVPNDLLETFLGFYKKIKSTDLMEKRWAGGKRFIPEGTQGRSIKDLNYWRNRFIHFFPTGLSIEVSGFPQICLDCINIVSFLALDSGHIYPENNQEKIITETTNEIRRKLDRMNVL